LEFFITWALILGLFAVPALVNYFANSYYSAPGTLMAPRLELLAASFVLAFAVLVVAVLAALLAALGWEDFKDEVSDFVQRGLVGYGRERPIALSGVLSAVSVAHMALMALLGTFRIPSRFVR
jgi:hypothetical protein